MSNNNKKTEIFEGKTFEDLTKDIYTNSRIKKKQLNTLIREIHDYIKTINDVVVIAPVIKELYDVSIKNDEHLVKLASVLQRIITGSSNQSDDDGFGLTEKEKEELMHTFKETAQEVQNEQDKINEIKDTTTELLTRN